MIVVPLSPQLTERDERVICDLARYRYLTTSQAVKLHFPSSQTASRRLKTLCDLKYLHRFRAVGVPGHGSNDYIHHLTREGATLAAYQLATTVEQIRYPKKNRRLKHGWRMDHTLAIVDFWIALDLACSRTDVNVARFIPEWFGAGEDRQFRSELRTSVPHPAKASQTLTFIPDAAFVLERESKKALFFLEVDRATETVESKTYPDFTDKLLGYASMRQHNEHQRIADLKGFRVLVTTVSEGRRRSYQDAALRLGLRRLFLFALAQEVSSDTVFSELWRESDTSQPPVAIVKPKGNSSSVL